MVKYEEIWTKLTKKSKITVRTKSQFFSYFHQNESFKKKQSPPVWGYDRALRKWQTEPLLADLICNSFESENQIFGKGSKNTWNFKEKSFHSKKFPWWKFWKCPNPCKSISSNSELPLIPLLACFRHFNAAITSNIWKCTFCLPGATRKNPSSGKGQFLEISRMNFF